MGYEQSLYELWQLVTKWDAHPVDIARCDSPNMWLEAYKTAPDTQIWTDLVA